MLCIRTYVQMYTQIHTLTAIQRYQCIIFDISNIHKHMLKYEVVVKFVFTTYRSLKKESFSTILENVTQWKQITKTWFLFVHTMCVHTDTSMSMYYVFLSMYVHIFSYSQWSLGEDGATWYNPYMKFLQWRKRHCRL